MSLSYSTVPYRGVAQVTIDGETKNVCGGSLQSYAADAVCRHLGYNMSPSLRTVTAPTDAKEASFSGNINCANDVKFLSQCSISTSSTKTCSSFTYIDCKFVVIIMCLRRKNRMIQRLND